MILISRSQTTSILDAAGWHRAEDDPAPTPFDHLTRCLGFSLQTELLINPPVGAVGFDLSVIGPGMEYALRCALYELFLNTFDSGTCHALCVNFGEWTFTPRELKLTSHYEPFPVSVTPYAEYVAFGNGEFSHGVFANPHNNHLVVFGSSFVEGFTELLGDRLVPAVAAARNRWAGG